MNKNNLNTQLNENNTPLSRTGMAAASFMMDFEYRSQAEVFGLPFVHITRGINPGTGRFRVARGLIAIGDVAIGGIALGGVTCGLFSLGGLSTGLFTVGGLAIGGFAIGGVTVGVLNALGVIAVSWNTAFGMLTTIL